MHNLAIEIALPMYLVDLCNEVVHIHGGWAGGETVHKALEMSYKGIKVCGLSLSSGTVKGYIT